MSFLAVRDLNKVHHRPTVLGSRARRVHAVRDVTFELARGETLGIVGESGSGKTSLARALLYLDPPTSGTVTFDGLDLGRASRATIRRFRSQAQIVYQDPHGSLDPRMRIRSSVAEALRRYHLDRRERSQRVEELLDLVGVDPGRMHDFPHQLSGGQRQRVVIARALAIGPELLLLDEPVSSLDVSIQAQIINLLTELKSRLNLTYIFISHDLNLVSYVADRIAVMKDGRIVELGLTSKVLSDPQHPYTVSLFHDAPVYVDRREVTHRYTEEDRE
jgi:ABC-type glutathione transport system ATPase component